MNKKILSCFLFLYIFFAFSLSAQAEEPTIKAKAAVLMDLETGQVLYEKNITAPLPPASTTKVLTAILAWELGNEEKICTISPKAAAVGEASLHLKAGEKLTLGDLLNGALICSGNDACVAIGENVAGTEALFVHWMNIKSQILGAKDSNFINTNGLPAKDHLVSAYDLALISRYALHNQKFSSVVKKRHEIIGAGTSKRYLKNTNKLLWSYPECIGVKTGTTDAAGPCLVSAVEKAGKKYLAVVLNSPDRYGESQRLLEYGTNYFTPTTIFRKGELIGSVKVKNGSKEHVGAEISSDETVMLSANDDGSLNKVSHLKEEVVAPVKKGQSLGHVALYDKQNKLVSIINVSAMEDIAERLNWREYLLQWASHRKKVFFDIHRNLI